MKQTVLDRFLSYISLDTTSHEETGTFPSTPSQLEFGRRLAEELRGLGLEDVQQDNFGYVTATIPATAADPQIPVLGLIAHMDTSDAVSGAGIRPRLVPFTGEDILLNEEKGISLRVSEFPDLMECVGKTLIVTDGTTLLGADDKAGVAEIVTAAQRLMEPDAPLHGKIRLAFTPDEEIGAGTDHFDVKAFGADFAYTVDGGPVGELEYENFNAASAVVEISGVSIHPGTAKGRMVNAAAIACEFQSMLPPMEQPVFTEGYEGFFHLTSLTGDVEQCTMKYIIRDHDAAKFAAQKKWMESVAKELNRRWGEGTVSLTLQDQYYNMRDILQDRMDIVDRARAAFEACGIAPRVQPIRGGTDGAMLSYAGLPCPNLSTGGFNYHSRFEFIPAESLEQMVEVLLTLVSGLCSAPD